MKNLLRLIIPVFLLLSINQTAFAQNETYRHNLHLGTGFSFGAALLINPMDSNYIGIGLRLSLV